MDSQDPAAPRFRLTFGLRLVLLLVALVAVAAFIFGIRRFQPLQSPPILMLPADSEISEVRAKLNDFLDWPGVAEFTVPLESVPDIMSCLRPPRYNKEPCPTDDKFLMGQLNIRTTAGAEMELRFYWTGQNSVVYTQGADQHQFYGRPTGDFQDGGFQLRLAIMAAARASQL